MILPDEKVARAIIILLGFLADKYCTCGYLLPSRTSVFPLEHSDDCPYKKDMISIYKDMIK